MSRAAIGLALIAALAAGAMGVGLGLQELLDPLPALFVDGHEVSIHKDWRTVPRNVTWVLLAVLVGGLAAVVQWRTLPGRGLWGAVVFGLSAMAAGSCLGWPLTFEEVGGYDFMGPGLQIVVLAGCLSVAIPDHLPGTREPVTGWGPGEVFGRTLFLGLIGYATFWLSLVFLIWEPMKDAIEATGLDELLMVLIITWTTIGMNVCLGALAWSYRPVVQLMALFLSGWVVLMALPDWEWIARHLWKLDPSAVALVLMPVPITALGGLLLGVRALIRWRQAQREASREDA